MNNGILNAEILEPGILYDLPRFEWSGIIKQVYLNDTHTFCSNIPLEEDNGTGYGIMNAFEKKNINSYIPKNIKRENIKLYIPEIAESENGTVFKKDVNKCLYKGVKRAFTLEKTIKLEENNLIIEQKLTNTGKRKLVTKEYGHNFTMINNSLISSDYEIEFSFKPEFVKEPKMNKENVFQVSCNTMNFIGDFKENSFKQTFIGQVRGFDKGKNNYWKITEKGSGLSVKETVDFSISKIQLWGKADTICPEVFVDIELFPGGSFNWKRTYTYEMTK